MHHDPSDIIEMQINLALNGRYSTLLDNSVIMLRSISQQWEVYIDQIQSQHFTETLTRCLLRWLIGLADLDLIFHRSS